MSGYATAMDVIRVKMNQIPRSSVYFSLKEYGVKRLKAPSVILIHECLALHYLRIPITVEMLEYLHKPCTNLYNLLHRLGDYNVLTLVKDNRRRLRFVMNPLFLKLLRLPEGVDEK